MTGTLTAGAPLARSPMAYPYPVSIPHDTPEDRGVIVRNYRVLRAWSINDLADACYCSPSYIRHIENNTRTPKNVDLWMRLAQVLRIPLHLLLGGASGGATPPVSGLSIADEHEILTAAWSLFYRGDTLTAVPVVYSAIQRIQQQLDAAPGQTDWLSLFCRFHQLAGVLARDRSDHRTAVQHATIAVDAARELGDVDLLAASLFRQARALVEVSQVGQAVTLSREALVLAPRCRATLRGYLAVHLADMQSRDGGTPAFALETHIQEARRIQALAESGQPDGSFTTLSAAGITHSWARIMVRAGATREACLGLLTEAQQALGVHEVRWRLTFACTAVQVHARDGDVEAAVSQALPLLKEVALSPNQRQTLQDAYRVLVAQRPAHPQVAALGAALQGRS